MRSFLACCSEDAKGQETLVTVKVADEKFIASGLNVTAKNYLEVYPYEEWASKEIHIYEVCDAHYLFITNFNIAL